MTTNKKEHILDTAESLFNEFGYNAVGVDLIRDKASVSKTSMYRYFGSKNKLIESLLLRRHNRFEESLNSAVSTPEGTENKLDAILEWHFSWFQSPDFKGCLFMHALAEFKGHDETIVKQAQQHKKWLKALLSSIFPSNQQDAETKAEALITFIEGMIVRAEFGEVTGCEHIYRIGAKAML
ncbi:TetR/AcrR family transcriptional regulator [Xenorhabdus sp. IM139775]|uniref:TetR/AcrR family transcriptional regulator n=1 Tax=Xenorhabdus sp. IM139775 TaxID=3025876 RepID=UPI0023583CE7|nr:TetR/AcrR family transcriptional regulator [Xenorhabdus sp. IM139775]MDC9594745.1 TetR/AcrR family transcriptional regulator [Xenorhabdus sp. IM139775]